MRQFFIFLFVGSLFSSPAIAGYQEGLNALKKLDYQTALKEWRPLAEAGDTTAQSELGDLYRLGLGVPKDLEEAIYWYRLAAEKGNTVAQLNLAGMYFYGSGIQKNDEQAVRWTQKAAIRGYDEAQFILGKMYSEGTGVKQDFVKAADWYKKAAEQGDIDAQNKLGTLYSAGKGLPKNDIKAAEWFRKAAEKGDVISQNVLGTLYLEGKGVPKNETNAAEWFRKAAEQGNNKAIAMLGFLYEKGQGVPKDSELAARLYRKAADKGIASAQYRLGLLYAWGTGVPFDYKEAESLWKKAANQGDQEAKEQLVRWHQKSQMTRPEPLGKFSDLNKSVVLALPLKKGLWKLQIKILGGSVSETEDEKIKSSYEETWCSQGTELPTGRFWPSVNEKDSSACQETTISETTNNRDFKSKCDGGMFTVEGRTTLTKFSENEYQSDSSQLYRMGLNAQVGGSEAFLPIPPMETNIKLKASFSGECSDQ